MVVIVFEERQGAKDARSAGSAEHSAEQVIASASAARLPGKNALVRPQDAVAHDVH